MKQCNYCVLFPTFCLFLISLNIAVSVEYTTNILHGSHVIVSHKHMVKLKKWEFSRKELFIEVNGFVTAVEPVINYLLSVVLNRLSTEDSLWDIPLVNFILEDMVGACHEGVEVGAYTLRFRELPCFNSGISEVIYNF